MRRVGDDGGALVGRASECARLDEVLAASVRGEGSSLTLLGDAGIGKTALLDRAASRATDHRVLSVTGTEAEQDLDYAVLHRLLRPLLDDVHLPEPQRDALDRVFGLLGGPTPEPFLVLLATFTTLTDSALRRPVLCIVDDVQWVDAASLRALAFVARRIHADRVALLFARREVPPGTDLLGRLPVLELGGLSTTEAHLLLTKVGGWLDPGLASHLIAETGGVPLALIELAGQSGVRELTTETASLPISARLEAHFLRRARDLPVDAQIFLLLVAADTSRQPSEIRRASDLLGLDPDAGQPAFDAGLVSLDPVVELHHPLVRSAAYNGASADDRRRVHAALAAAADERRAPERRAWHLGSAATGLDDEVADELVRSAERARLRGGYVAEAGFLVRAAELTTGATERAHRLIDASQAHLTAGNLQRARQLLDSTGPLVEPLMRARSERLRASLDSFTLPGDVPAVFFRAARAVEPLDARSARDTYADALQTALVSLQLTTGTDPATIAQAALAAPRPVESTAVDLMVDAVATRLAIGFDEMVPLARRALEAFETSDVRPGPIRWSELGPPLLADMWDAVGYRRMLERLEIAERDAGAMDSLRITVGCLGHAEMWAGHLNAAELWHSEATEIAVALDGDASVWDMLKVELRAWQGRENETRAIAGALMGEVEAFGAGVFTNLGRIALAVLENSSGDHAAALEAAWPLFEHDHPAQAGQCLAEIVEAGARGDGRPEAAAALERLRARARVSATPWALGLLSRSEAMLAGDGAEGHFRTALDHLERSPVAIERARTHLLFGEWLRRRARKLDAREHLSAANRAFATMGAEVFAARAATELAATGERIHRTPREVTFELTPRETQVASLAAQGATNREIAEHLFISANTVDYHLRKVYRKLEISSRRDLRRVFRP